MSESITFVVTEPFEYSPPAVWERIVYSSDLAELFMPLGNYYGVAPSFFADDKKITFKVYLAPDVTVPCWLVTDSTGSLVGEYGIQSCIGSRTGAFESTWVVSVPDEIKHLFGHAAEMFTRSIGQFGRQRIDGKRLAPENERALQQAALNLHP